MSEAMVSDRIVMHVAAAVFDREIGDCIAKGERLGYLAGTIVQAPFDGHIQRIARSLDGRGVLVTIEKTIQN